MPVIVFTGGGTAGHVTPNFALMDAFNKEGWDIHYIGSATGPEAEMTRTQPCRFHPVASGKLRRYFSWQNFVDPFKSLWGIFQAWRILGKVKADVMFSKGGFVAFPGVVAAWLRRIPVVAHESDFSPGLANRLSYPFARKICLTFSGAKKYFNNPCRIEITGTPIRQGLDDGIKGKGLDLCGFDNDKTTLMMMGGSQGAVVLNQTLRQALPDLLEEYQVIHVCGRGKVDPAFEGMKGYKQFEFVSEELPHLFAAADLIISRAGANTLYELLVLQKPHLLIPLSAKASRGDQIENACYFAEQGVSAVLEEEQLSPGSLTDAIKELGQHQKQYLTQIKALDIHSATDTIVRIIKEQLNDETPAYSR